MSENLRFVIAAVLMAGGVLSGAIAILGVFRFRVVMNRMHCAAILDTLGMAGILGGLMVASWSASYIPKLLCVLLLLWVGSPAASHLVGRMEIATDETASEHISTGEEKENGSV